MSTPTAARWRREATVITDAVVLHADDRKQALRAAGWWRRTRRRTLQAEWAVSDERAAAAATSETAKLRDAIRALRVELSTLESLERAELRGRGDAEARRLDAALEALTEVDLALDARDFGTAGRHADQVVRSLAAFGGPLAVAVSAALEAVPLPRRTREELAANHDQRIDVEHELLAVRGTASALGVAAELMSLETTGLRVAAAALRSRPTSAPSRRRSKQSTSLSLPVQGSEQLETFTDVAGLDETIDLLVSSLAPVVEGHPTTTGTWRNGVLLHGPPGTGKTLLSRAFAGEHGLRHIRLTPASLGSSAAHQSAQNLLAAFELAAASTPCVLLIDEIDVFAGHRTAEHSADQREIVTQLMACLEDFRTVPGLVVMAATNDLDRLDPGLREGRFDLRVLVPLPDVDARADVLRVHLEQRGVAVVDDLDLMAIARRTAGRNCAALEDLVVRAIQRTDDDVLAQEHLEAALRETEASDRLTLDARLTWDDVVLADAVRRRIDEVLRAFTDPETAAAVGVEVPAGLLLYGPPGTGKTTVAKVLASEAQASFLEISASDLLSKYAGESEQKVTRLFERARAVRPTIIFIDEVDGLLRRRRPDSTTPWDDRVVNEFLRQLDGLRGLGGVLLVAATNRPDVLDDAVIGRRLLPLEVGLPDEAGRRRILELLTRGSRLGADVDLQAIAAATAGMSGADLRSLRDGAGLRALGRRRGKSALPRVRAADFEAVLEEQRERSSLAQV